MSHEIMDVANDVRLAARRLGFRRRHSSHAADTIDDQNLAIVTLGVSFLELNGYPTAEQRNALLRSIIEELDLSQSEADDQMIVGRWIMAECGTPAAAIDRVSNKLFKLSRQENFETLMRVFKKVAAANGGQLTQQQTEALHDTKRALRIR